MIPLDRPFLFDVDGTLVLADDPQRGGGIHPLDGACAVLGTLRSQGARYAVFTNGTGQTPREAAAKLRAAGLDVADEQMLTPAVVASEHIRQKYPGEGVLAFGREGVMEPLRESGIRLLTLDEAEQARVVLIGADSEFTYDKLVASCRAVWAGAALLVTSMAPHFASRGGRMPSPSGAIAAGIRYATGVEPTPVGKPSALVLRVAARLLEAKPSELVVVGDDPRLEVRMAHEAGAYSVLVLSGSSTLEDVEATPEQLRPDLVIGVVGELLPYLN